MPKMRQPKRYVVTRSQVDFYHRSANQPNNERFTQWACTEGIDTMSETNTTPSVTMEQLQAALAVLKMADPALQASIGASLIPSAPLPYVGKPLTISPHKGNASGKVQTLRIAYVDGVTKDKTPREKAIYLNLDSLAIVLTNAAAVRKSLVESLGHFHAECFETNTMSSYQQALAACKLGE